MELEGITPDKTLDTTGLSCPMPLLKTKKALTEMASGQVIEVISSDPGSKKDISKFGNKGNNTYLGNLDKDDGFFMHYIKKG